MGNDLLLLKKYQEAIAAFEKAVSLDKDLICSYYNLACLYALTSQKDNDYFWSI